MPEACSLHERRRDQIDAESRWAANLGPGQAGMFWCVPGAHYVSMAAPVVGADTTRAFRAARFAAFHAPLGAGLPFAQEVA